MCVTQSVWRVGWRETKEILVVTLTHTLCSKPRMATFCKGPERKYFRLRGLLQLTAQLCWSSTNAPGDRTAVSQCDVFLWMLWADLAHEP